MLWILLPITSIGVALAMVFALLAEFIMAIVKGIGNFIKINKAKCQTTCKKVIFYLTLPLQGLVGLFVFPCYLSNDESYKFGEYTKVVWHYAQKALPVELRHCCHSGSATATH